MNTSEENTITLKKKFDRKRYIEQDGMSKKEIAEVIDILRRNSVSQSPGLLLHIDIINKVHRYVAIVVLLAWMILTLLVMSFIPSSEKQLIHEQSRNMIKLASIIMTLSFVSKIIPVFFLRPVGQKTWRNPSGVLLTALVVQFCAAVSNGIIGWFPVPIHVDPITKCDVNLLRWCEWIPLSFAMAFLTDGIDAEKISTPLFTGFALCASTIIGSILAFLSNIYIWISALTLSVILYSHIFSRAYYKINRLKEFPKGNNVDEIEEYTRVFLATRLMIMGSATWGFLATSYFIQWYIKYKYPHHVLHMDVVESIADVVAKHLYLNIVIDAHNRVFDYDLRIERNLEELRRTMAVIWNSSKDILAISVKTRNSTIKTEMSPALFKLLLHPNHEVKLEMDKKWIHYGNGFTLEQNAEEFDAENSPPLDKHSQSSISSSAINDIKLLVHKAWSSRKDPHISSDSSQENKEVTISQIIHFLDDPDSFIHSESNISSIHENSLVIVLRDVTERYNQFETEKTVLKELTSRKKDNEANKFTRHEVKNGLLAAIGLCDNLKDELSSTSSFPNCEEESSTIVENQILQPNVLPESSSNNDTTSKRQIENNVLQYSDKLDEINVTLNQTLDIVVTHAMTRDLVNGEYTPRPEYLDLPQLLRIGKKSGESRYRLSTIPDPFPPVALDARLLNFVHSNAVTNAKKYGKKGGVIETILKIDNDKKNFEMQVVNLPGQHHEEIMKSISKAKEIIFAQGKSLHTNFTDDFKDVSAGDGAWIMKKSALCMGGDCDILFEKEKTIFSLVVPNNLDIQDSQSDLPISTTIENITKSNADEAIPLNNFSLMKIIPLPHLTWGIAIDDSKVQRKLMKKFLQLIGIQDGRIVIKGSTGDEIFNFVDFVVELVNQNLSCHILIIADEYMDLTDETTGMRRTFSGSLAIQEILQQLRIKNQDSKVLALVRSANDSSSDLKLYKSRAHGFLPKVPLNKSAIESMLAPIWKKKFTSANSTQIMKKDAQEEETKPAQHKLHSSPSSTELEYVHLSEKDPDFIMKADFINVVDQIDLLVRESWSANKWELVQEHLHVLKGDLMTQCKKSDECDQIMAVIDVMRGEEPGNDNVINMWKELNLRIKILMNKTT